MRLLWTVLLLLLTSAPARAALWDITVTGQAVATATGEQGLETVIYRYDPADLEYTSTPLMHTATGPIQSVTYSGLVHGVSGPATLWSLQDCCAPYLDLGNTSFAEGAIPMPSFFVDPYPFHSSAIWPLTIASFDGGEPGFRWLMPLSDPTPTLPFVWYSISVEPTRLSSPSTLLLLPLVLSVIYWAGKPRIATPRVRVV